MSASSRVMAVNYIGAKMHYKYLYYSLPIETNKNRCNVCSTITSSIRINTCCYSCYEKQIACKSRENESVKKKVTTSNKKRTFKFWFFR